MKSNLRFPVGVSAFCRDSTIPACERLALSRDKDEVMCLASEGLVITKLIDLVKQPTVLEFLGVEKNSLF